MSSRFIHFKRIEYPFLSPRCEKCMDRNNITIDWRSPNNSFIYKRHGKDDILLVYYKNIFDLDIKVVPQ